jgi:integrase
MNNLPRSITPISPAHPVLDPVRLDAPAQAALQQLLAEGESASTVASYASALRYWSAWFRLRYGQDIELPVAPATVVQFVLDHAQRQAGEGLQIELPPAIDAELVRAGCKGRFGPLSLATITHRVSVLSKLHELRGAANPCQDVAVRELLASTRKAFAKRGDISKGKPALTREPMEALLATCDDTLPGKRDRALLLFAWATGGRRRSEVTAATLENVERNMDGTYTYFLGRSKTNAVGARRPQDAKPVAGRAAEALSAWLAASRVEEGAIFRRVRKGSTVAEPLTPAAVRTIVMQRCQAAGIETDYSAHSLRSGYLTEAGRCNVPMGEALGLSGHTNFATALRYYRAGSVFTERASRLLDEINFNSDHSPRSM